MSRLESIFFASVLFSPGENQIVKVDRVDWTAALDRRAGPPRWTAALDHRVPVKITVICAGSSTAAAGELREVGGVLPARNLAAVAAPLYQDLVTLAIQHPPRGIFPGRWIVEGIGIGGR
jgi:hypothetical protein